MLGETMGKAMEGMSPLNQLEEVTRNNMALFEKTMQMFAPFGTIFTGREQNEAEEAPARKAKRAPR
jgi:polyhydroxyalkanoate synthesis regulator protein